MSRRTQRSVVVARPHNGHSRTYDPDGATPIVLEYLRSRNIQHSGIGADILQLTDDLSSMLGREAIIVTQQEKLQGAIVKRAGVLTRSMKTERSARGRKGVRCERRECIAIEGKSKDISSTAAKGLKMKHCSGCQQVCYCSSECQRLDWPRHRQFCKTLTGASSKDGILSLVRNLLSNQSITLPLKNYVRTLIGLDAAHMAGLKHNVIFTCTLIPTRDDPDMGVFQIKHVELEEIPMDEARMIQQLTNGPDAIIRSGQTLKMLGPGAPGYAITMTFKTDRAGANASIVAEEEILPLVMANMPPVRPSAFGLVIFNRTVREDHSNVLKLRMPIPRTHDLDEDTEVIPDLTEVN